MKKKLITGCTAGLCMAGFIGGVAQATPVVWPTNNHTYDVVTLNTTISWETARDLAAATPGCHLVTMTTQEEDAFVISVLASQKTTSSENYWLGLYQLPGSEEPAGGWTWVTGEPLVYTKWYGGGPNNGAGGTQNYLHYYPEGWYQWDDMDNRNTMVGYVVECGEVIPPKPGVTIPLTGIITTRNWEYGTDQAQFKLTGMQAVKDDAKVAIDEGLDMTIAFGKTCEDPIYTQVVPASSLNNSYLNLRYTEGNLDVVRCVYNSGECVINIKNTELKSLTDADGNILDDLCSGPMTVCLTVGNTTYTNSGTWTQYDGGSGSWMKCRKDIATETNKQ